MFGADLQSLIQAEQNTSAIRIQSLIRLVGSKKRVQSKREWRAAIVVQTGYRRKMAMRVRLQHEPPARHLHSERWRLLSAVWGPVHARVCASQRGCCVLICVCVAGGKEHESSDEGRVANSSSDTDMETESSTAPAEARRNRQAES